MVLLVARWGVVELAEILDAERRLQTTIPYTHCPKPPRAKTHLELRARLQELTPERHNPSAVTFVDFATQRLDVFPVARDLDPKVNHQSL
jgi:hypothetical protein